MELCVRTSAILLHWIRLRDPGLFSKKWLPIAFLVSVLGLIMSLSRAAWLTAAVGLMCVTVVSWGKLKKERRRRIVSAVIVISLFGILALLLLFLIDPNPLVQIWSRTDPFTMMQASYGAGSSRLYAISLMEYLIQKHPLFGWGAGSMGYFSNLPLYQQIFAGGGEINAGHGSANWILNTLVEEGIVGFVPVFLWVFILFFRRTTSRGVMFRILFTSSLATGLIS